MDSFSATAGVVGLLTSILHGPKRMTDFTTDFAVLPKTPQPLSTRSESLLRSPWRAHECKTNCPGIMRLYDWLRTPLENCLDVFEEFTVTLHTQTEVRRDGPREVSEWKGNCLGVRGAGGSVVQGHDLDEQTLLKRYHWSNDIVIISACFNTPKEIADTLEGSITTCIYKLAIRIENSLENRMRQIRSQLEVLAVDRFNWASELARKTRAGVVQMLVLPWLVFLTT